MRLTESVRRILCAMLALVLVFSLVPPTEASAASASVDAAIFFSDLHSSKSDSKTSTTKNIMSAIAASGLDFSSVTSVGDVFSSNETNNFGSLDTITSNIRSGLGDSDIPVYYAWSDHDRNTVIEDYTGLFYGAGKDGVYGTADDGNYYVYTISMSDMATNDRYKTGVFGLEQATLDQFTADVAKLDHSKPMFIASHQPLLDRRNDNGNAYKWCQVINAAAEQMDIILLFGHNHNYDTAADYYYAKGSTMSVCKDSSGNAVNVTLNFTHINTGYMSPSTSNSSTRKGTAMVANIMEDSIQMTTYNASGVYTGSNSLNAVITRDHANASGTPTETQPAETQPAETKPTETLPPETEAPTEPEVPAVPEGGKIWRQASTITAGKKYMLVNYGYNASGMGTYAVNSSAGATEVTVKTDATGAYIVNDDESLAWEAKANSSQFRLANAETGKYLRSAKSVSGTSSSAISVTSSVSSSYYANWSMETKSGKTVLSVRRSGSSNYYPVQYSGSSFLAYNYSQLSSKNNWLVVFVETDETAHTHSWTTTTVAATCTTAGSVTTACACGQKTVEQIAALGHDYACVVTEATCGKDGAKVYTCSRCADTYSETIAATGKHTNEVTTVAATCTASGSVTTTCTVCGETTVERTAALGHDYACVITEATCALDGAKVYTCGRCANSYSETIPATGNHDYVSVTVDAGCTEAGSVTHTCSVCADSYVDVLAALGHSYSSAVTAPTCTETGYTTYTCDTCGHAYTDNRTAALGHAYESEITATCTEDGFVVYTCTTCGYSYNGETVKAYGHDYTESVVAPTCGKDGYTTFVCATCGHSYIDNIVTAPGHAYAADVTAATCTEGGWTTFTCTACGDSYVSDYTAALGHAYHSVVTEPTFEEMGYTTHTCTVCGDVVVDSYVPVKTHTYETETVAATCEEDGYIAYTCVECGYSYTEIIAAFGHSWNVVTKDPSCEQNGSIVSTCATCGHKDVEVLEALGHDFETVVIEPTCETDGYTTYTCACGHVVTDVIEAVGHDFKTKTIAPTCTAAGAVVDTCSTCGYEKRETIAALGHSYTSQSTVPTCTKEGYTTYTCATCGDSYVSDKVAALGHSHVTEVTAPTCTAAGYTTYTCTVCGASHTGDQVAALGHSYTSKEENGYMVYTCGRCGDSYSEKLELTYTKVSSISSGNAYVITLKSGTKYYALSHKNNTISAVQVKMSNNQITSEVTEDLVWTFSSNKLSYVSGNKTYYLYAGSSSWWGSSTLSVSTSNSSTVSFSSSRLKVGSKYLRYSGGSISLSSSSTTAYVFKEE